MVWACYEKLEIKNVYENERQREMRKIKKEVVRCLVRRDLK